MKKLFIEVQGDDFEEFEEAMYINGVRVEGEEDGEDTERDPDHVPEG